MHDRFHWNVMSGRYSEMPEECWTPTADEVRTQGTGNKQVANGVATEDVGSWASLRIARTYHVIRTAYKDLLGAEVGREQARTVLPMGQYTEAYVTANLGDWLLFLKQRLDPHAQKEIRDYAEAVYAILYDLFPVTMQAFMDYQLNSVRFSAQEMEALKDLLAGNHPKFQASRGLPEMQEEIWTSAFGRWTKEMRQQFLSFHLPTKRERQEFWRKINGQG